MFRGLFKKIGSVGEYLLEIAVYACFISAYFSFALNPLNGFLKRVFDNNKVVYPMLALALISVQGFALERLTSALLHVIPRTQAFLSALRRLFRPHETITRPANLPGLVVYRFAGPLFFFNAAHFARRIKQLAGTADPPVRFFLINAEAIVDVDMAGVEVLEDLLKSLKDKDIVLAMYEVKGHFRDVLFNMPRLEGFHIYPSVAAAVRELAKEKR